MVISIKIQRLANGGRHLVDQNESLFPIRFLTIILCISWVVYIKATIR